MPTQAAAQKAAVALTVLSNVPAGPRPVVEPVGPLNPENVTISQAVVDALTALGAVAGVGNVRDPANPGEYLVGPYIGDRLLGVVWS